MRHIKLFESFTYNVDDYYEKIEFNTWKELFLDKSKIDTFTDSEIDIVKDLVESSIPDRYPQNSFTNKGELKYKFEIGNVRGHDVIKPNSYISIKFLEYVKGPNGDKSIHSYKIYKITDEYFLVGESAVLFDFFYKCDTIDGLTKLLNDRLSQ